MGDTMNSKPTMTLNAGGLRLRRRSSTTTRSRKRPTVVQVHAIGPFQLTYVNAADDPTRKGESSGERDSRRAAHGQRSRRAVRCALRPIAFTI